MPICSLHWHSRYSICILVYFPIYFIGFMAYQVAYREVLWQNLPTRVQILNIPLFVNRNWFIAPVIACIPTVHVYFSVILLFWSFPTSTSEMALIDWFNPSHNTDACLHYTLDDICVVNDSGIHFYFCSFVEASSLKVLFHLLLICYATIMWVFIKLCNTSCDSWAIKCQMWKTVFTVIPVLSLLVRYRSPEPWWCIVTISHWSMN